MQRCDLRDGFTRISADFFLMNQAQVLMELHNIHPRNRRLSAVARIPSTSLGTVLFIWSGGRARTVDLEGRAFGRKGRFWGH